MFGPERAQPLLDELATSTDDLLICGYNGADYFRQEGLGGMPQCEPFVVNFLHTVTGIPLERIQRLSGGVKGWQNAGHPLSPIGSSGGEARWCTDAEVWTAAGVPPVEAASLEKEPVARLAELLATGDPPPPMPASSRPALMEKLKELGFGLARRQQLATFLSKAVREGKLVGVSVPSAKAAVERAPEAAVAETGETAAGGDAPCTASSTDARGSSGGSGALAASTQGDVLFEVVAEMVKVRHKPSVTAAVAGMRRCGDVVHAERVLENGWIKARGK
eukprot:7380284-Prymnesium_polylepis.1